MSEKRIKALEVQINGDPLNNDDHGIKGVTIDHELRIEGLEKVNKTIGKFAIKTLSGLVLAALIGACTYFADIIREDGSSTNNNNNHSNTVGSGKDLFRGRQSDNHTNNKSHGNGQ